jgi:hypothetical protein
MDKPINFNITLDIHNKIMYIVNNIQQSLTLKIADGLLITPAERKAKV